MAHWKNICISLNQKNNVTRQILQILLTLSKHMKHLEPTKPISSQMVPYLFTGMNQSLFMVHIFLPGCGQDPYLSLVLVIPLSPFSLSKPAKRSHFLFLSPQIFKMSQNLYLQCPQCLPYNQSRSAPNAHMYAPRVYRVNLLCDSSLKLKLSHQFSCSHRLCQSNSYIQISGYERGLICR